MMYWAVGVFGMIGAALRYETGTAVGAMWPYPFPLATLLINYAGCLVLGWFTRAGSQWRWLPVWLRTGFGTGLIGSFTTFSTFSVETIGLLRGGRPGTALLYVVLSMAGGLLLAWLGYCAGKLPAGRAARREGRA